MDQNQQVVETFLTTGGALVAVRVMIDLIKPLLKAAAPADLQEPIVRLSAIALGIAIQLLVGLALGQPVTAAWLLVGIGMGAVSGLSAIGVYHATQPPTVPVVLGVDMPTPPDPLGDAGAPPPSLVAGVPPLPSTTGGVGIHLQQATDVLRSETIMLPQQKDVAPSPLTGSQGPHVPFPGLRQP
jgi:hypothetical protein